VTQRMERILGRLAVAALLVATSASAMAKSPDCTHPDAWPSSMAFTHMKNAGLVDNEVLDFKRSRVDRLASEKIGKDLYRQVHLVHFFKKSGEEVNAITVNEVSHRECSESDVDVFVVSKHLGNYTKTK
jgi:hypothetical protein